MIGASSASVISESAGLWERGGRVGVRWRGAEAALQRGEMYRRLSSVVSHTLGSGGPSDGLQGRQWRWW